MMLDLVFVYGLHIVATRKPLWLNLFRIISSGPWVAIGDFNTVFATTHRINGVENSEQKLEDGVNWIM